MAVVHIELLLLSCLEITLGYLGNVGGLFFKGLITVAFHFDNLIFLMATFV